MKIESVSGFAAITPDPATSRKLYLGTLGLPLEGAESEPSYIHTESLDGAKHFGVWPLEQAAEACFGTKTWPEETPIPQASIEFEVADAPAVGPAAEELRAAGYKPHPRGPRGAVGADRRADPLPGGPDRGHLLRALVARGRLNSSHSATGIRQCDDRWLNATHSRPSSRPSAPICGRSPTGCSVRSARPTTRCRRRGCASAAPTPARSRTSGGWLTTVVGRVCLDMLRSRRPRREEPLDTHVPEPIVDAATATRPRARGAARRLGRARAARRARDADPGRAARVRPARHVRRAVRRDRADRRPLARRPPASSPAAPGAGCGARRPTPDADLARQREVVDAFLAAAREGDFDALRRRARPRRRAARRRRRPPAALDASVHGAEAVAEQALQFARLAPSRPARARQRRRRHARRPATAGRCRSMAFTVRGGRIVAIDILADPARLRDVVAELD